MILAYLGDALWVLVLAMMFGASRRAAARIPQGARPPVMGARLPRVLALWALPGAAFLLSLWFLLSARQWRDDLQMSVIVFGVRAATAPLIAMLHLSWLRAGMDALAREGVVKP